MSAPIKDRRCSVTSAVREIVLKTLAALEQLITTRIWCKGAEATRLLIAHLFEIHVVPRLHCRPTYAGADDGAREPTTVVRVIQMPSQPIARARGIAKGGKPAWNPMIPPTTMEIEI